MNRTRAARHEFLTLELYRHSYKYYVLHKETVSDTEYDLLARELSELEREYPELVPSGFCGGLIYSLEKDTIQKPR